MLAVFRRRGRRLVRLGRIVLGGGSCGRRFFGGRGFLRRSSFLRRGSDCGGCLLVAATHHVSVGVEERNHVATVVVDDVAVVVEPQADVVFGGGGVDIDGAGGDRIVFAGRDDRAVFDTVGFFSPPGIRFR